jgi:molybdopterin-containing oxidoreductase family iron-sulfur binding subunit
MGTNKVYWKGFEELEKTPEFVENANKEFPQELTVGEFIADDKVSESSTNRRDFLKFLGFSVAAATLAACEAPVIKAVPYVVKPEDVTPGVANWYASTYYDGAHYSSILVKSREGRPIMIKGNCENGFTGGATNPQIIASVLSLYNASRLDGPLQNGTEVKWQDADINITADLRKIASSTKKIILLSATEISPSTRDAIGKFKKLYSNSGAQADVAESIAAEGLADVPEVELAADNDGDVVHIQYDAVSYSGMREANLESFGKRIIPDYDFSKAKTIVSFGADFLNSWILSTQFTHQYLLKRDPDGEWMSRHYQFESNMSQTGSNADYRGLIKPSQQGAAIAYLHAALGAGKISGVDSSNLSKDAMVLLDKAAEDLKASKKESLIVSGSNDKAIQLLVNSINQHLGAYKKVINLNNPINLYQSEDEKMQDLIEDMNAGNVGALIMWNTNPVYSHENSNSFKTGLEKVSLTVSMSQFADETASLCTYICPENHSLESWNDFNPKGAEYAVAQPTIRPLFNTRSVGESFLIWSGEASHVGKESTQFHDHMKVLWEKSGFSSQTEFLSFHKYWNAVVHQSTLSNGTNSPAASEWIFEGNTSKAGKSLKSVGGDWELSLYEKAGLGNGSQAANPWLQELPDTITKVTWDNYITMSYADIQKLGLESGLGQETPSSVVTLSVGEQSMELPVYPQAGQMEGTIGLALGYGRGEGGENIGKGAFHQDGVYGEASLKPIGGNAFKLISGNLREILDVKVSTTDKTYPLACTQTHSTVMARNSIVKETTLEIYKTKDASAYNHKHVLHSGWNHDEKPISEYDLWEEHPVEHVGHRWGMSIDLNTCIGCGSCVIACHAENNVPVVGKDEVRRGREMHWLRLDRYYASDVEATVGTRDPKEFESEGFSGLKQPGANPKVVHMPMMCQHCNHAPCETVCPVAATTHSNEGLNQMTYNRCIGTRYCGNNCPYKVRRFNWFNYPSYRKFVEVNPAQDDLGRMVLNPDVVVRTRGVMEKCSFCVQEIQAAKLKAKKADRMVKDGDIDCACAGACPTSAIQFGDWNDVTSAVRAASEDKRAYQALEEIGVKPNIWYKVKVRNEENSLLNELQEEHHAHGNEHGSDHDENHGEELHDQHADDHGGH